MASKLCCTAEQEGHPDSPELPNARVNDGDTPTALSLLPEPVESASSPSGSARADGLREVRQIFRNVEDNEMADMSRTKAAGRARITRPSVYSLHSLHKMKSMRSLIRRKFSRDLIKKPSGDRILSDLAKEGSTFAPSTGAARQSRSNSGQLGSGQHDMRRDILSDKRPHEGGYDSDAQVLDDIAKNIGKTPNKRVSIHSIDWTPSTASKTTPGSSSKSCQSVNHHRDIKPYRIKKSQSVSLTARMGQVFSSPNLQVTSTQSTQEHRLRRSHSATSNRLPKHSPLSPLRLPSLKTNDPDGIPWSEALNESLQLSHLPALRRPITPKQSQASPKELSDSKILKANLETGEIAGPRMPVEEAKGPPTPSTVLHIRVQEPTALTTPRQSGSLRIVTQSDSTSVSQVPEKEPDMDDEEQARKSVHLYSMRISHHLRSGSLLSWDTLVSGSESSPTSPFRDGSFSDVSRLPFSQRHPSRQERQTSSSGFASSRVPSKWGKVLTNDIREDNSSIYSSRPQSPPESPLGSFGGSMINLSTTPKHVVSKMRSSLEFDRVRRSNSNPTDNDETPRPPRRHGLTNIHDATNQAGSTFSSRDTAPLARGNSVVSTKDSKFREEFSPSPPKRRLIPSASIMRFFGPNRIHSETHVTPGELSTEVDGLLEVTGENSQRERRNSKSIISFKAEHDAIGRDKKSSPMWERALQNYQDEKAAMLLPHNKNLVPHANLFRERSGSISRARQSEESETTKSLSVPKRLSAPHLDLPSTVAAEFREPTPPLARRTALLTADPTAVDYNHQDAQLRFSQQTDTIETVGAWGRYPSHTRAGRTLSAGHQDNVKTRDFALEAAIRFAMNKNSHGEEEELDPSVRPTTPPLLPGQKKRKKKMGNYRMMKSHSMTFGKSFLKNYTKIFRSQSIEFQRHGSGHRSSIAAGGMLDYPELEIVPDVWSSAIVEEPNRHSNRQDKTAPDVRHDDGSSDKEEKGKTKEQDSASTLRPIPASSRPTTSNLLEAGLDGTKDTARVWSAYYENCLPSFPNAGPEPEIDPEEFGARARRSMESRRASMRSRTMPLRSAKHSRNTSRMSHFSESTQPSTWPLINLGRNAGIASHASARPSFVSMGDTDGGIDGKSIVSVRRSTMDLVSMYKKQEDTEMERVLSMVRSESTEVSTLKGL